MSTSIEWTDETWNPTVGCTRVSKGCDLCYAAREASGRLKNLPAYEGLAVVTPSGRPAFTGRVRILPERLDKPLRWRDPKMIFVDSMSDLFHELIPDWFVLEVFDVMRRCTYAGGQNAGRIRGEGHTFQVLTKRPERMAAFMDRLRWDGERLHLGATGAPRLAMMEQIWLGTSAEDQEALDLRVPVLLGIENAAVRFLSAEPLLGPLRLRQSWRDYLAGWITDGEHVCGGDANACYRNCPQPVQVQTHKLEWVIVGGESGPGYRKPDPAWVRDARDQCVGAGTAFLFKQWGGRTPKAGGRIIDQRTWDEYPQVANLVRPALC